MASPTHIHAPPVIKVQGQLYVRAAEDEDYPPPQKHKKCPKGKHWHTKKQQCLPLPKAVLKASNAAHEQTEIAKEYRKGRSQESMMEHSGVHSMAADLHDHAAFEARAHGFHELADHHDKLGDRHHEKSNEF
jgi:hypothetical protein